MTQRFVLLPVLLLSHFIFLHAQNWTQVSEVGDRVVNAITEHHGVLYAATDSAIFRSLDGGNSWSLAPQQPVITSFFSAMLGHGGFLYLGTRGDGVFRSADSGTTWQSLNTGLSGFAKNIAEFAVRGDSLFAGTDGSGIYLLNLQNPTTWTAFNTGLFQFGTTSIIASGTTLVASIGQYVFVRRHGAAQWVDATIDSIGNRTPIKLFRMDTSIFLGTSGGIFRSDSNGGNWRKADITPFPNRDIVAFAAYQSRLFAGLNYLSDHWVFSTDDYGTTWEVRAHEFAPVQSLFVTQGKLWAGRADGLWWFDLSVWTGIEKPNESVPTLFALHQNYPNPFNPETEIRFQISEVSRVNLRVYDVLGKEVARLVDERLGAGMHSTIWDGSNYPSGVYFYRLQARSISSRESGTFSETRKLLLVR